MYKRIENLTNDIVKFKVNKKAIDKFNLYMIIIILISLLLPMAAYNFEMINPMTFYNYIYIAIIPMLYIFIYNIKNKYHKNSIDFILISVFMIIAFISSLHAFNPWVAFLGHASRKTGYLTYLLYYFLYINSKNINDKSLLFKILDIMLILGMINTLFALLQVYMPYNVFINKLYYYMGCGLVGHPNFLGTLSTLLTSLSLYISLFISDRKFYKFTTIIMFICLILASSTGPFLSFGLAGLILFIYIILKRRDLLKQILMYALIFGITFIAIEVSSTSISKIYKPNLKVDNIGMDVLRILKIANNEDIDIEKTDLLELKIEGEKTKLINSINEVSSGRLYVYKAVVRYINQDNYIWLGTGPDNMHIYHFDWVTKDNQVIMTDFDKAHNVYLNIVAETGIFSFIVYVAWIICYHVKTKKCKNELMYLLLFGLISYNIQGLFNIDVFMVMPYYFIIAGMLMGIGDKLETRKH